LLEHFWLLCGLVMGIGSFITGKVKSKKLIESGEYSKEEVDTYLKRFTLYIFVPSMIFWFLQMSIGAGAGVDFLSWPNPQKTTALFILIGLWGYLFVWTLFLDGAEPLSRCLRLVGDFPLSVLSPFAVKVLVCIVVISGVMSLFMERI